MSIRFRKRIKIIPGVYLNVSKSGVSTSIGPGGTNVNIGKNGSYLNLGIPGTGISHRQKISGGETPTPMPSSRALAMDVRQQPSLSVQENSFYDKSKNILVNITNPNLETIKTSIEDSRAELLDILKEGAEATKKLEDLKRKLRNKSNWISKFFNSKEELHQIEEEIQNYAAYLEDLQKQYDEAKVNITISSDPEISQHYENLRIAYQNLLISSKIWDITSEKRSTEHKSSASNLVDRKDVKFSYADLDFINTEAAPFHLENADGDNIYIYPAFVLQIAKSGDITITDFSDFQLLFRTQRFLEEEHSLPLDAVVIDHTWAKVNKDGSPDRRFAGNYQIPVVNYGTLEFTFPNQITESYYVSNVALAEQFAKKFETYLSFFKNNYGRENISSIPNNQEQHNLSDEYIELLKDITWKMIALKEDLIADKNLNENVVREIPDSDHNEAIIISSFLLHDFNNIFKRINPEKDHFKTYGTFFILNNLLNNDKVNLSLSNEEIRSNYKYINNSEIYDIIINSGSLIDSFNFKVDKETYDFRLKTNLILTPLLKSNDIPVLEGYKNTLHNFALVLAKMDRQITAQEEKVLKELFAELSDPYEIKEKSVKISKIESNNLGNALDELNSLIGLKDVKDEINKLVNFIKVQKAREQNGLKATPISHHMVFSGNPGTGKTTVARIVSKIYKELGILSEGHLVETDRSGLVAEYVGQTATKVNKLVDTALNGVLFVDEAYALVTDGTNDYGKEAIATLIKRIEDDRDKIVVIFAGYSEEMNKFLDMNPGFQSRINRYLDFKDYSDQELKEIFLSRCKKLDYHLTPDALVALSEKLQIAVADKDEHFGNARYVRNLFEKTLELHANRLASEGNLTKERLTLITYIDIA